VQSDDTVPRAREESVDREQSGFSEFFTVFSTVGEISAAKLRKPFSLN
jgi:hypothetical protein